MRPITNFKLGIGFCCSWPYVSAATFFDMLRLHKPDFQLLTATDGPTDSMRNKLVEDAFINGCSHLLMMDLDQTYPPGTILQLLSRLSEGAMVVNALVPRRRPPFDFIAYAGNPLKPIEGYEPGSLVEVDRTGCGCILVDMRVFSAIDYPYFRFTYEANGRQTGEDYYFCEKVKRAGFKIFVDTAVKLGHISTMEITESTANVFAAMERHKQRKES